MDLLFLFAMVIALLLLGAPIFVSLGLSSIIFLLVFSGSSLDVIAQTLFNAFAGHYTLLAIPFFILASTFMSTGGVAKRIIRFAIACVGHLQGGLAIASVFACMLFAALSGSSPATVVAIGTIVIAGMRKVGYTKDFAAGVICNAGTLGILIPPSIVMVVYASSVDVSVGRMFLAGVIPGILAGLMLMTGIYVVAKVRGLPKQPWAGWGEVIEAGSEAGWGLFLIVIILGGIYGGIFTPTEAAAVGAVGAFLLIALKRRLTFGIMRTSLMDTGRTTAMIFLIIIGAVIFSYFLAITQIPVRLSEFLGGLPVSRYIIITAIIALYIPLGMFIEVIGMMLLTLPILFPIVVNMGFDPVWFGVVVVIMMEAGLITPPVGINVFVISGIAKEVPLYEIFKGIVPFFLCMLFMVALLIAFPQLALWLPGTMLR